MHAVPAFDDHPADDELGVYSRPARIAEALRSNESALNARGFVENGRPVSLHEGGEEIFHNTDFGLAKASNLDNYGTSILTGRCRHSIHVI
jgi:hypothetical protein